MNGSQWTGVALGATTLLLTESGLAQCHDCGGPISQARMHLEASAALGQYILLGGGRGVGGNTNRYDIYDACADVWSWIELGTSHEQGVAVAGCGKVWFAGGTTTGDSGGLTDTVTTYDSSLGDPTNPAAWSEGSCLSSARRGLAGAFIDHWAIFVGGIRGSGVNDASDEIDIYDCVNDVWHNDVVHLSSPRFNVKAITVGHYVLVIGGFNNTGPLATIDWYDANEGDPTNPAAWHTDEMLVYPRYNPGVAAVGTKVVIGGGLLNNVGPDTSSVEFYDSALGAPDDSAAWSEAPGLSLGRYQPSVTTLGDRVIFAGGVDQDTNLAVDVVDIYDMSTGLWSIDVLCQARGTAGAGTACGKAVFAGGFSNTPQDPVPRDEVDVFYDCVVWMPCFQLQRLMLNEYLQAILARGFFDAGPGFDPSAEAITFEVTDVATGKIFTHEVPAGGLQLVGSPASQIYEYETPYGTLPDFRVHVNMKKGWFRLDRSKGDELTGVVGPDFCFRMITSDSGVGQETVTTEQPGWMWFTYLPGFVPDCDE